MKPTRRPLAETNVVTTRGTGASVTVSSSFLGKKVRIELIDMSDLYHTIPADAVVIREVKRQRKKGGAHVWVPKEWLGRRVKITPIS